MFPPYVGLSDFLYLYLFNVTFSVGVQNLLCLLSTVSTGLQIVSDSTQCSPPMWG